MAYLGWLRFLPAALAASQSATNSHQLLILWVADQLIGFAPAISKNTIGKSTLTPPNCAICKKGITQDASIQHTCSPNSGKHF